MESDPTELMRMYAYEGLSYLETIANAIASIAVNLEKIANPIQVVDPVTTGGNQDAPQIIGNQVEEGDQVFIEPRMDHTLFQYGPNVSHCNEGALEVLRWCAKNHIAPDLVLVHESGKVALDSNVLNRFNSQFVSGREGYEG